MIQDFDESSIKQWLNSTSVMLSEITCEIPSNIPSQSYDISSQAKQEFWSFVKISEDCGAFDDEAMFRHFRKVYEADYEEMFSKMSYNPSAMIREFIELIQACKTAMRRHARELYKSGSSIDVISAFTDVDLWLHNFAEVAAFRRIMFDEMKRKADISL